MAKGIMALEDNLELAGVVADDGVTAETSTEFTEAAEAPLLEMNEAQAELEQVTEDMEQAADVAGTLDEMNEEIAETLPEGGLSEPAAAAIEVAVEALRASVGFPRTGKAFAMEGFGDKSTRVQSTKVAMEGIADTAKKIWQGIVNAFKAAVEWVKKFFASLFDASVRLQKRAAGIAKSAEEKEGKKAPADAKLEDNGVAAALHQGGKIPSASQIVKGLEEAPVDSATFITLIKQVEAGVVTVTQSEGKTPGEFDFDAKFAAIKAPAGFTVPEGCALYGGKLAFGDAALYMNVPKKEDSKLQKFLKLGKLKVFVSQAADAKEAPKGELPILTVEEVKQVAEASQKSLAAVAEAKKEIAEIDKVLAKVISEAEKASKKEVPEEGKKNMQAAISAARSLSTIATTSVSQFKSYSVKTNKAALDYAAKSLKLAA
jgi:hypothetical protein